MPWDKRIEPFLDRYPALRAIGNTPLVPVSIFGDELPGVEVLAKMECLNPGGSLKDRPVLRMLISQPFVVTDRLGQFDVWCTVAGGGLSGQAGAVRHGISKALTFYEPGLRPVLKHGGFLTRDSRVVERKKYGRHKARRRPQYSKR